MNGCLRWLRLEYSPYREPLPSSPPQSPPLLYEITVARDLEVYRAVPASSEPRAYPSTTLVIFLLHVELQFVFRLCHLGAPD